MVVSRDVTRTVIAVRGELDVATGPALEASIGEARAAGGELILDLRELRFIDASGLAVLLRAQQRARRAGQRFAVSARARPLERLLALTGLRDELTVVAFD